MPCRQSNRHVKKLLFFDMILVQNEMFGQVTIKVICKIWQFFGDKVTLVVGFNKDNDLINIADFSGMSWT